MSQQLFCDKCGKEIDAECAFFRFGKPYCEQCYHIKTCHKCGKEFKDTAPVIRIHCGTFCEDCLFPNGDFAAFEREYEAYLSDLREKDKSKKKKRLLIVLIQLLILIAVIVGAYFLYDSLYYSVDYFYSDNLLTHIIYSFLAFFVVWLIVTVKLVKKHALAEPLTMTEYYDKKYSNHSCYTLTQLYGKLYDGQTLTLKQMKQLINDFLSKAELAVASGNAGKYKISRTHGKKALNGFLVIRRDKAEFLDFRVFVSLVEEYDISISDEYEIWILKCVIRCLEKGNPNGTLSYNKELAERIIKNV